MVEQANTLQIQIPAAQITVRSLIQEGLQISFQNYTWGDYNYSDVDYLSDLIFFVNCTIYDI